MRCIDFRAGSRLAAPALATLLVACSAPAPGPWSARPPSTSSPPAAQVAPSQLPPRTAPRRWDDFKQRAAQRLMAANPQAVYDGPAPDPLLAIPVLEIELERDGRVRHIKVLRYPTQAKDTTQLAIDAVHRAAPFDDVGSLPRPWKFVEVFLFDDERRFKPRTLD